MIELFFCLLKSFIFAYISFYASWRRLDDRNRLKPKCAGSPSLSQSEGGLFFSAKSMLCSDYLHVNGTVNREEIAGILWENMDNQIAKKNLRKYHLSG